VKVLFVMLHAGFARYYESVIRELSSRGHRVHIAYEVQRKKLNEDDSLTKLVSACPGVTSGMIPYRVENVRQVLLRSDTSADRSGSFEKTKRTKRSVQTSMSNALSPKQETERIFKSTHDGIQPSDYTVDQIVDEDGQLLVLGGKLPHALSQTWQCFGTTIRLMQDYLRYFDPLFAHAFRLRSRAEKRVPKLLRGVLNRFAKDRPLISKALIFLFAKMEHVIPTVRAVDMYLQEQAPDILLVTPLVDFGSQQVDYIKSARRRGIPSIHCVASWDNLTSKGLMRIVPDQVLVWNESQKVEANLLHNIPNENIVITGAQLFDQWFESKPVRTHQALCQEMGISEHKPYLLYLGSSHFIAPNEAVFVARWIDAVRRSKDRNVAECSIVIRPHPANVRQFRVLELERWSNVAIWPSLSQNLSSESFKQDYFDSLYHSVGVVGVNTSALVEAAIVGRTTCTIRDEDFMHAQEGTLHFQHLSSNESGCLFVADNFKQHVTHLSALFGNNRARMERSQRFVESFVRPCGIEKKATSIVVDTIEQQAALNKRQLYVESTGLKGVRSLMYPFAAGIKMLAVGQSIPTLMIRPLVSLYMIGVSVRYRISEVYKNINHFIFQSINLSVRRAEKNLRRQLHRLGKASRKKLRHARKKSWKAILSIAVTMNRVIRFRSVRKKFSQAIFSIAGTKNWAMKFLRRTKTKV